MDAVTGSSAGRAVEMWAWKTIAKAGVKISFDRMDTNEKKKGTNKTSGRTRSRQNYFAAAARFTFHENLESFFSPNNEKNKTQSTIK